MPHPEIRRVLIDEAPVLRSSRDMVRVSWIQPYGELVFRDTLGPHYPEHAREYARFRVLAFLRLAETEQVDLAVAPEYFMPIETLKEVVTNTGMLREGTVYVLPVESMDLAEYEDLGTLAKASGLELTSASGGDPNGHSFVNACAVLSKGQGVPKLFLQTKISPSRAEEAGLITGQHIFAIEGDHMVLIVLICSDANPPELHPVWADAAARKSGAYIVHAQWNPHPDYEQYPGLWSAILGAQDGPKRILLSINWAVGSRVSRNGQVVKEIRCSRSRLFRGKELQRTPDYPEASTTGLHVSHYPFGRHHRKWEIWHGLPPQEHVYVVDIPRPFEDIPPPQHSHLYGIRRSRYFELENVGHLDRFTGKLPDGLAIPFWNSCERFGLDPEVHVSLDELPLSETERLINACLCRKNGSWMVTDITCRVPTAALLCNRETCENCLDQNLQCYHTRRDWERDARYLADCLQAFYRRENSQEGMKIRPTDHYPMNLVDGNDRIAGWLLHGQGQLANHVEKDVQLRLDEGHFHDFRGVVHLFVFGAIGNISLGRILSRPGDDKITPEASSQDITSSYHGPEFKITNL